MNQIKDAFTAATAIMTNLTPTWHILLEDVPLGRNTESRIINIQLSERRGFEADELTITLSDHDGLLEIPMPGYELKVWLGYDGGVSLYKGSFKISELSHNGSPDTLSITARSADINDALMEQDEKSWSKTTLFNIVETIAKKHKYKTNIAEEYKTEKIDHIDQTNESDASFLTRLADMFNATTTIKNGTLIFTPIGQGKTASGKPIPTMTIVRQSGDQHTFTVSDTESYNAVKANYIEKDTGKKKEVIIDASNVEPPKKTPSQKPKNKPKPKPKPKQKKKKGKSEKKKPEALKKISDITGLKIKTLRWQYKSEAAAIRGARSAFKKLQQGIATFEITLAGGRPELIPEMPVEVKGFKELIDNQAWLISEIDSDISQAGYSSQLKLEVKVDFSESEDEQE